MKLIPTDETMYARSIARCLEFRRVSEDKEERQRKTMQTSEALAAMRSRLLA
jgi:hypothetical protein